MNNVKIPVPLKPSNNKEYINPALVLLAVFDRLGSKPVVLLFFFVFCLLQEL